MFLEQACCCCKAKFPPFCTQHSWWRRKQSRHCP